MSATSWRFWRSLYPRPPVICVTCNAGWVHEREGLKMKYWLCAPTCTMKAKRLQVLADVMTSHPGAQALRGKLRRWLANKPQARGERDDGRPGIRAGA